MLYTLVIEIVEKDGKGVNSLALKKGIVMYYPSLQRAITANQYLLGADFENLGKSQRIYLSYYEGRGWSIEDWRGCLGFLKSIFRWLGIAYTSTHLRNVHSKIEREGLVPQALLNKIRACYCQQVCGVSGSNFLTLDQQSLLSLFLGKLQWSADYGALKSHLKNIFHSLEPDRDFRNKVFDLLETNRTYPTCGDGTMLLFHDLEIEWQWHQKGLTHQERANLAVRIQRYQELLSYVKRAIVDNQWQYYDQAEIYLYYQIKLRKQLALPISAQNMLHPNSVPPRCEAMLTQAVRGVSFTRIELLARSERWRTYLQAMGGRNAQEFNEMEDRFGEQMQELYKQSKKMKDGAYTQQCSQIRANREAALQQWTVRVTQGLGIY